MAAARTTQLRLEGVRPLLSLSKGFHVGYLVLVGIAAISFIFALTMFPDVRQISPMLRLDPPKLWMRSELEAWSSRR